jgi:cytochrome c oxidase subunit II
MTRKRHFTTRRGFVGALGFGSLGLYATWAAYGASPLPFGLGTSAGDADSHAGHSENGQDHSAHSDPAMAEAHGASHISPAEFERRHADFLNRFREVDGSIRPVAENQSAPAAIDIYFSAGRYAFEPDDLQLKVGQTYRFYMMATDIAHGASIAFGQASRIVRLRPNVVTTLDLTFKEPGPHLIYCTVYCGPGHDTMHARVTVA